MAEFRRLLIDTHRLVEIYDIDQPLLLNSKEFHYLKRVLRLQKGDSFSLVDGQGKLWQAIFQGENEVFLTTTFKNALQTLPRSKPLLGIAVAIPKRGFDDVLRMSTEIGIDIIQPLSSERSFFKKSSNSRFQRWQTIIREAVEQSERLWAPKLLEITDLRDFIKISSGYPLGIATTRDLALKNCNDWLNQIDFNVKEIWIAIGPEGGWTVEEEALASGFGSVAIEMGTTILRTSTAAIVATQNMALRRRTGNLSIN